MPGRNTIPNIVIAKVHDQGRCEEAGGWSAAIVRDVVVTVTVKAVVVLALNGWLAGTVHVAPSGAPVQLSDAVPPSPAPPIERL